MRQGLLMESIIASFGEKLLYLRHERQLTQIAVGRELSLASSVLINMLESGKRSPSVDVVLGVANLFGVTTDYLIWDTIPSAPVVLSSLGPSPIPPQLLGRKLKYLRSIYKYKQLDLAQQLGLRTQAHISHIEAGRHDASLSLVMNIATVFKVTTDYLLRDDEAVDSVVLYSKN